jgi:hypothetical protein
MRMGKELHAGDGQTTTATKLGNDLGTGEAPGLSEALRDETEETDSNAASGKGERGGSGVMRNGERE